MSSQRSIWRWNFQPHLLISPKLRQEYRPRKEASPKIGAKVEFQVREVKRKPKLSDKVRYNGLVCKIAYVYPDSKTVNLAMWLTGEPIEPRGIDSAELIFADENGNFPIPDKSPTLDDLQSAGLISIGVPAEAEISLPLGDQWQLDTYEATIAAGLDTFQKVGNALMAIRDNKLYRAKYSTFEDYLLNRWQMGRSYASRIMGAAEVTNNLLPVGNILPTSERQARPMNNMPPEQAQATWERAVTEKANGEQPTAKQVEEAAKEVKIEAQQQPTAVREAAPAKPKPHVSHNSGENEWYTPALYIQAARQAMGGIDLDPASSEIANQVVCADYFYTLEDDGLKQDWTGRIWLNPPYSNPEIGQFATKVVYELEQGRVDQLCVLVNNASETVWFQTLLDVAAAVCFPKSRIKFLDIQLKPEGKPLQGQAIFYIGANVDAFTEAFEPLGKVLYAGQE